MIDPIKCDYCERMVRVRPLGDVLSLRQEEEGHVALVKITAACPECGQIALDIEGFVDSEEV